MREKEFLPTGVQLIEAGYGGRVADLEAAAVKGVVVAVVDTGEAEECRWPRLLVGNEAPVGNA